MKKERKVYENEFLTRYRKQQKAKPKKRGNTVGMGTRTKDRSKERTKRLREEVCIQIYKITKKLN